ncbi:hypothetical protein [Streptomyces swartbergensis]|uniref:hypothetical protein n=1 Tax=Streptomyces swartbergensis TaxID=487165 RepID=UPI003825B49C
MTAGIALISHLLAKAVGADVSWFSMGLEALGAIPGIGAFAKGVKVADGAVAATRARQLGEGFRGVTTMERNIVGIGDTSREPRASLSRAKPSVCGVSSTVV